MKRYYFDTNALYAFYRHKMVSLLRNPRYANYLDLQGGAFLQQLVKQNTEIFVSRLTCLEFISVLLKHERGKELKKVHEVDPLLALLKHDIEHTFRLEPQTEDTFLKAQELLLKHARRGGCALETNDAIHIATAMLMQPQAVLVTSDGGKQRGTNFSKMKCVCQRIGLEFFDPEQPL